MNYQAITETARAEMAKAIWELVNAIERSDKLTLVQLLTEQMCSLQLPGRLWSSGTAASYIEDEWSGVAAGLVLREAVVECIKLDKAPAPETFPAGMSEADRIICRKKECLVGRCLNILLGGRRADPGPHGCSLISEKVAGWTHTPQAYAAYLLWLTCLAPDEKPAIATAA